MSILRPSRSFRRAKFRFPLVSFIDTPGADPTLPSEERGQALAIATNLLEMARLETTSVAIVIGEGGSGGAIAIGLADRFERYRRIGAYAGDGG